MVAVSQLPFKDKIKLWSSSPTGSGKFVFGVGCVWERGGGAFEAMLGSGEQRGMPFIG